jgi:hypothetical protein
MFAPDVAEFSGRWRGRIEADPLAAQVMAALWAIREEYAAPMLSRARRESDVMDSVIANDQAESLHHVLQHFRALLSLPTARASALGEEPLAFVHAHGTRRARAGVPLLAQLQAYRTGHKSFWSAMCDIINARAVNAEVALRTTILLSEYCIEYTDLISTIMTDAYLAEETQSAAQRARLSVAVVEDLLKGALPVSDEALALCGAQNIGGTRPMAVLLARTTPFSALDRGAVARAIEAALPQDTFGRLVEVRADEVVAVASGEAVGARMASAVRAADIPRQAPGLRIGIGLDVDAVRALPRSYGEALAAIDLLPGPVAHLADTSIVAWLRHIADETAQRLAPPWIGALADGGHAETLQAFADASLNVKACARRLKVHNNTIYHRLNRVRSLTGVDPRSYAGLSQLLTALAVADREAEHSQAKSGA